jgi:hypothetical protein
MKRIGLLVGLMILSAACTRNMQVDDIGHDGLPTSIKHSGAECPAIENKQYFNKESQNLEIMSLSKIPQVNKMQFVTGKVNGANGSHPEIKQRGFVVDGHRYLMPGGNGVYLAGCESGALNIMMLNKTSGAYTQLKYTSTKDGVHVLKFEDGVQTPIDYSSTIPTQI